MSSVSSRPGAVRPAHPVRLLAATLAVAGGLAAMPALAYADESDLVVVATRAKVVQRDAPAVVTVRLRNDGTEAFDPKSARYNPDETAVRFRLFAEGAYAGSFRSNPGWSCNDFGPFSGTCLLDHAIPAGGSSLPVEVEVLPGRFASGDTLETDLGISGSVAVDPALLGVGDPSPTPLPVEIPAAVRAEGLDDEVRLNWAPGAGDHARAPQVAGVAGKTELAAGETTTVSFEVTAEDEISTGPYNAFFTGDVSSAPGRSFNGDPSRFPNAQLALTVPQDQAELVGPVQWFGLLPENTRPVGGTRGFGLTGRAGGDVGTAGAAPRFGESEFTVGTETPGEYRTEFPAGFRYLPGHPVRIVATVKLKDGVDRAELLAEASAPGGLLPRVDPPAAPGGRAAGRALLADPLAARATVVLTRAVAPTPTPTPAPGATPTATPAPGATPTPAPAPAATPTPTPAPAGGVLGARAAPRLVGKATFRKSSIRVGKQTTLTVSVRNTGNAASDAGRVCVRLSPALVVVKVPKGVTTKGSQLCASRSALTVDGSLLAIKGVVVRGVSATPSAQARDGAADGVEVTGDRLAVLQNAARPGGVTG